MSAKKLLLCISCLLATASAMAQFKIETTKGQTGPLAANYASREAAVAAFEYFCRAYPSSTADVIETASGARTPVDCQADRKRRQEKAAEMQARDKAAAGAQQQYVVFAQKASGEWVKMAAFPTAQAGLSAAQRQCIDRRNGPPNRAGKVVDPAGKEQIVQCQK